MMNSFPVDIIRKDFPILNKKVNNNKLVYFDNAATTQKPNIVIDSLSNYYRNYNSNIHRGVHTLAEKATQEFEETRSFVKNFINAKSENEIIFTRGATEGINLISSSYCRGFLKKGDEIIISEMEHHSNIVPWQMISKEMGLKLKTISITKSGEIDLDNLKSLLNNKTKFLSIVFISNTLGTINPIKKIIKICRNYDIKCLIDGAQASAHTIVDVQELDCDFYVFSAHKMYGPTGVGVVYGKENILEKMPPYMGGGEMIKDVSFKETSFNKLPYKFEAGTPNIGDVIGFKESINYINNIGRDIIEDYENTLRDYTKNKLQKVDGLNIVGTTNNKIGIFSFTIDKVHYFDLGLLLDAKGIAIRTGHHCTQPLMEKYHLDGTARLSLALYNTKDEVDYFIESLNKIISK
tara:strand:+ start:27 stop:1247 length:1221 start_codon:yes stop_codon:yes gene_type:complete